MKFLITICIFALLTSLSFSQEFSIAETGSIKINPDANSDVKTIPVNNEILKRVFPELRILSANTYQETDTIQTVYGDIIISFDHYYATGVDEANVAFDCEQKSKIGGSKKNAKEIIKSHLRDKNLEEKRHRVFTCTWKFYKEDDDTHWEQPTGLVIIAYGKGKLPHTIDLFPLKELNYSYAFYPEHGQVKRISDVGGFEGEEHTKWQVTSNIREALQTQLDGYLSEEEVEKFDISNYRIRLKI